MGTGIVANAAVALPVQIAGQRTFALLVWLGAATLLVAISAATAALDPAPGQGASACGSPRHEPLLRRAAHVSVGTVVTGTSGLAGRTGLTVFAAAAAALYVFLLLAWGTVLVRTVRGAARGELFLPPAAIPVAV